MRLPGLPRSRSRPRPGRIVLASTLLLLGLLGNDASAQLLDDRLVPGGTVRTSFWPSFTSWNERFTGPGETGRSALGAGLTVSSALDLFPGGPDLTTDLRTLSGNAAYTPVAGPVEGRVGQDVTRLDFGIHVGITDWWTVGATFPRLKNETTADIVFRPDTLTGDLGVTPYVTARAQVDAFLGGLTTMRAAAADRATALCDGGDPQCAPAQALAARVADFDDGFSSAYQASPFFPLQTSTVGTLLSQRVATLDADLQAAGLAGIGTSLVLSSQRATEGDLRTLPVSFGPLGYREPLGSRASLWAMGDIELTTTLRLLEVGSGDPDGWSLTVLGGALLRLGTGAAPDPDVPLDLGSGDGQTDVEGRLSGHAVLGGRGSLRAGVLYGSQGSRTLEVRALTAGSVLAPLTDRVTLDWSPAAYWRVEVEPGFSLAPELTLAATYRYFRKGDDVFLMTGAGESPVALATGGRVVLHHVGASLTYDMVRRAVRDGARPLRFRVRWVEAVAGSGLAAPVGTRIEFSAELFHRLWGGP